MEIETLQNCLFKSKTGWMDLTVLIHHLQSIWIKSDLKGYIKALDLLVPRYNFLGVFNNDLKLKGETAPKNRLTPTSWAQYLCIYDTSLIYPQHFGFPGPLLTPDLHLHSSRSESSVKSMNWPTIHFNDAFFLHDCSTIDCTQPVKASCSPNISWSTWLWEHKIC